MIPKLEYKIERNTLKFRYADIVEGFDMPVKVQLNDTEKWIYPTATWKTETLNSPIEEFAINRNFYIESEKLK